MANGVVDFSVLAGDGAPMCSFKAGDVIFREGDPAEELFIVKSGKIEIRLGSRLLETLSEFSIFGEMGLIDHSARCATAVAATDATVVPVAEKQFLFLTGHTPHFALNVMRVLAPRLRRANNGGVNRSGEITQWGTSPQCPEVPQHPWWRP